MVTTTTGTITIRRRSDGSTLNISSFIDDITLTFMPMNLNGIAVTGGLNFITVPGTESDVWDVFDMSYLTGPTVIKVIVPFVDDGLCPGKVTLFSNVLSTLTTRSFAPLMIKGGHKLQFQAI
jgi:hypothetical protein